MSKKNKRQTRSGSSASPYTADFSGRRTEFEPDYSYVIKDLRRIGILAGTFISFLVILSFFLG